MKLHMKHNIFIAAILLISVLGGCRERCEDTVTYTVYEPIYASYEEFRSSVKTVGAQPIENSGRIYTYGQYLYINERGKGIHIIDNSEPRNPRPVSFIEIPGNGNVAAYGPYIYADSFMDLVVFDISRPENPKLMNRVEDAFPQPLTWGNYHDYDPSKGVIIDWKETQVTEKVDCSDGGVSPFDQVVSNESDAGAGSPTGARGSEVGTGQGGSMARFTVVGDYLYSVDHNSLMLMGLAGDPLSPKVSHQVELGVGIETIFPYKDQLYVGSQTGMHIFDNANPAAPELLSSYSHVTACDPVVVQDDIAYVTLRSGTDCWGTVNELQVINVSNPRDPQLMWQHQMQNPHGLGIDGDKLFICEGEHGLKFYDADDVSAIQQNLKDWIQDVDAYDVIPRGNILMMVGKDGLYQFDYSGEKLELLSVLHKGN